MAAQGSVKDWFTFVGGLNTEGGYFVTPDNSWTAGSNVIPQSDGSVHRRNGLDLEKDFAQKSVFFSGLTHENYAVTTFTWTPLQDVSFVVVQQGSYLFFYTNTSGKLSEGLFKQRISLRAYPKENITYAMVTPKEYVTGEKPCTYSEVNGSLIVTSEETIPFRIYYEDDELKTEEITIKIRDFSGFNTFEDDPQTERTEAEWDTWYQSNYGLSNGAERALYNLKNQGWTTSQINTYKTANSNKLPANTKSWIYGKNASDVFDATLLNKQDFGTSLAPKGRNIIDAFNQVRTEGAFTDTVAYISRPTLSASFAGRVWYSGLSDSTLQGKVYFSQVIDNFVKLGYCYQSNDPTSEIISDLIDSDGGVLEIPDAGKIVFLAASGRALLVFGENGVFAISGIDGVFSATNYQVEKVTSVGAISPTSIVVVENEIIYWSTEGVYILGTNDTGFSFKATNISDQKIKSFYNDIPLTSKKYAKGSYNSSKKELYWIYNSESSLTEYEDRYKKNAILALNIPLGSWHTHDILADDAKHMQSILTAKEISITSEIATVVDNNEAIVVDGSANEITGTYIHPEPSQKQFKVIAKHNFTTEYTSKIYDVETYNPGNGQFKAAYGPVHFCPDASSAFLPLAVLTADSSNFWASSRLSMTYMSDSLPSSTFSLVYTLDTSDSNALHTGWGTQAFCFSPDGLRLYAVQHNGTSNRFGYYTLPSPYSITSPSGFTSLGACLANISHIAIENGVFSWIQYNYISSTQRTWTVNSAYINKDGSMTSFPPASVWNGYTNASREVAFNWFSFTPDGMNIIVGLTEYNGGYPSDTVYLQNAKIYPLLQPWVAGSFVKTFTQDGHDGLDIIGYRDYVIMLPNKNTHTDYYTLYNFKNEGGTVKVELSQIRDEYKQDLIGNYNNTYDNNLYAFSIADFNNQRDTTTKFKDWYTVDNASPEKEAYVITGYQLADVGPARMKSGMYVTTFAKRTETKFDDSGNPLNPSSVLMQLRWDFTDNYNAGKWAQAVETYRHIRPFLADPGATYESGYPLVTTKNKIRGRGKALQFKFSTSDGKDMQLVGWTGTFVGNTNV